jgi:hypothetical protein
MLIKKGKCFLIDNAILGGRNVIKNKTKKILKCNVLRTETAFVKTKLIPAAKRISRTV